MMNVLYTRVTQEWQDLDVAYPQWLRTIVMDDVYYTAVLIMVCANAFAVGLALGWLMTVV